MFVPDRVVGDAEVPGDGRHMCFCVESGEGDGGGRQFKPPCSLQLAACSLQGQGSTSSEGIPSQDLQRRVWIWNGSSGLICQELHAPGKQPGRRMHPYTTKYIEKGRRERAASVPCILLSCEIGSKGKSFAHHPG